MVDQNTSLERLRKEKGYEDKLVIDINNYLMFCIEDLPDLTDFEKNKIKETLGKISADSSKHSYMFSLMIQLVLENGEQKY